MHSIDGESGDRMNKAKTKARRKYDSAIKDCDINLITSYLLS